VVFRDGLPSRQEYRKFLIKTAPGDDDYAGMEEVIYRRLKRNKEEGKPMPDLLLLDGGPGQLHAAELGAAKAGVTGVAMVALAKREELLYLPGRPDPVKLPDDSPALHLLQRARDEVHRYVNAYQRTRRAMTMRAGAKVMMKARRKMLAESRVEAGKP
jgi:excinuclease ABC subunit C